MKKVLARALFRAKKRFQRVWQDQYTWWWHLFDVIAGITMGIAFAITFDGSAGLKVGLFFAVSILGYLITFAFTYGIVRARNGWTKKNE